MQEKHSIITELIRLAKIDQHLSSHEYDFLRAIALQLGITNEELEELYMNREKTKAAPDEFNRILQFHRLLLLANIDLEVDVSELVFLREAGFRMGLNPLAVETVISEMKKSENGIIEPDKLIRIFQVHHN